MREQAEEKMRKKSKKSTKEEGEGGESESESEEEEEDKVSPQITDNALRTPMERWEKSLMTSSSLSKVSGLSCCDFGVYDYHLLFYYYIHTF